MKIVIDLTALLPWPRGVDTYLLQLVRHLGRVDLENDYTIFVNFEDRHRLDGQLSPNFHVRALCLRPRPIRFLFQQVILSTAAASADADVVHSPAFLAPYWQRTQQHMLTVHDMTFFSMPHVHSRLRRCKLFRYAVLESIRRAHLINVPSDSTRRDLLTQVRELPPDRVRITPFGIDSSFSPAPLDQVLRETRRLRLPERYILFLGHIEPRKNIELVIDAYRRLIADSLVSEHLVIAGRPTQGFNAIVGKLDSPALVGRVHLPGFIAQEDVAWVYRGARLFVYPSLYEGFGFPPLESMACGIPTICTESSALGENLRGAAELVAPDDATALAGAMRRLLLNKHLRDDRKRAGLERAASFRWERTAHDNLFCYRELAAHRRRRAGAVQVEGRQL
jgi:glycosyltransferase involved in cell wall biosynthesis